MNQQPMRFLKLYFRHLLALVLLGSGACYSSSAQLPVHLTGPDCVVAGIPYQYLIVGSRDTTLRVKVCVTGGKLVDSSSCTATGQNPPFVQVVWSLGSVHELKLQTTAGTDNLPVMLTNGLTGGEVAENDRIQFYDSTKMQVLFPCSPATGGSCSPVYLYQWQQSENGQTWQPVNGAMGKDLVLSGVQHKNLFYRRMVREVKGGMVSYSNEVQLIASNQ